MRESLLEYEFIRNYLERRVLCSVRTGEKRAALTFDDGPNPRHTPALLDLLKARNVKATFFLVGKRIREFPQLTRRIAAEGHEIGNHGYHHVPITVLPPPLLVREVSRTGELIHEVTKTRPTYFRPPMGWINGVALGVVRKLGYEPVIGTIHPRDFASPGIDVIVERIRKRISPGSIIILHDGGWRKGVDRSQTIEAVNRVTVEHGQQGYRFETLSQLTGSRT